MDGPSLATLTSVPRLPSPCQSIHPPLSDQQSQRRRAWDWHETPSTPDGRCRTSCNQSDKSISRTGGRVTQANNATGQPESTPSPCTRLRAADSTIPPSKLDNSRVLEEAGTTKHTQMKRAQNYKDCRWETQVHLNRLSPFPTRWKYRVVCSNNAARQPRQDTQPFPRRAPKFQRV
jgi:hypothetical protein